MSLSRGAGGLIEALLFTGGVLAYLWLRGSAWAVAIPAALAATTLAWRRRAETWCTLGLDPRQFGRSLAAWRYWYAAAAAGLIAAGGARILTPHMLRQEALYLGWCAVQQLLYQSMVCKPLRRLAHPGRACWIAAALFALVHLPNPVLVPATFAWGVVSCHMFRRLPSVLGLALLQSLLSSLLYWLTPWDWHRGFRVGIGYFLAV